MSTLTCKPSRIRIVMTCKVSLVKLAVLLDFFWDSHSFLFLILFSKFSTYVPSANKATSTFTLLFLHNSGMTENNEWNKGFVQSQLFGSVQGRDVMTSAWYSSILTKRPSYLRQNNTITNLTFLCWITTYPLQNHCRFLKTIQKVKIKGWNWLQRHF